MRTLLLPLSIAALVQGLLAQDVHWLQHAGTNLGELGCAVDIAPNGDVVVFGTIDGYDLIDFDAGAGVYEVLTDTMHFFVARYAPSGELLHVQRCQTAFDDGTSNIPPLMKIHLRCSPTTGNLYLAGEYTDNTGMRVAKTDPMGNVLWVRNWEYPGTDYHFLSGLDVDSQDNVYIAGDFEGAMDFNPDLSETFTLTSTGDDFFITKLNADGGFEWAVKHDWAFDNDHAAGIVLRNDSSLLLLSSENGELTIGIYEYGPDGTLHWRVPLQSGGGSEAYSIDVDAAGCIYIHVSTAFQMDMDPNSGVHYFVGSADGIAKYDPTMHYLWHRSIAHSGVVLTVRGFDAHGAYLDLAGSINGDIGFGSPVVDTLLAFGLTAGFVARYDTAGTYQGCLGLRDYATCEDLVGDEEGRIYACGEFGDSLSIGPGDAMGPLYAQSQGQFDYWLAHFEPEDINTAATFPWATPEFAVFPNPSRGTFTLRSAGPGVLEWVLLDQLGSQVARGRSHATATNRILEIGTPPPGIYTLALSGPTGQHAVKVAIQ